MKSAKNFSNHSQIKYINSEEQKSLTVVPDVVVIIVEAGAYGSRRWP